MGAEINGLRVVRTAQSIQVLILQVPIHQEETTHLPTIPQLNTQENLKNNYFVTSFDF